MVRSCFVVLLVWSFFSVGTYGFEDIAYFTIESVETKEQEISPQERLELLSNFESQLNQPRIKSLKTVTGAIKTVWTIIKDGKPSSSTALKFRQLLPGEIGHWNELTHWQGPQIVKYRTAYKNHYGISVADFTHIVIFYFGGKSENKGAYMANLSVYATDVSVLWGFDLNSFAEFGEPINFGSLEDPMMGLSMIIKSQVGSLFMNKEESVHLQIKGDGSVLRFSL